MDAVSGFVERLEASGVLVPDRDAVIARYRECPGLLKSTEKLLSLARELLTDSVFSLEIFNDECIGDSYVILYARFSNYDDSVVDKIRYVRRRFLSIIDDEVEWPFLTTDFRKP